MDNLFINHRFAPWSEYVNAPYMWQDWTTLSTGAVLVFFFNFDTSENCYTIL